jgi:N-terminal acetyltransferase B complex non-catalytic subunit
MDAKRLEFLQSPFLGPESTIAKGDWELWRIRLELMRKTLSPDIFQTTADLLRRARTKDNAGRIVDSRFSDWEVWQLYIEAALSNKDKSVNSSFLLPSSSY